jgi:Ribbon-helix-helix protein, copG family
MTRDLQPKKSEKIEVRLDCETKRALQERAQVDGLSVSDLIRGLITRYLSVPPSGALQSRRSQIMRLSSMAAALCGALFVVASLTSPARARDVTLGVTTMVLVSPNGALPMLDGRPQANVDLDFGKPVLMCVPKGVGAAPTLATAEQQCLFASAGGYSVLLWALPGDDKSVMVGMRLLGADEVERQVMIGPQMLVAAGETANSWTTTGGQEVLGLGVAWLQR